MDLIAPSPNATAGPSKSPRIDDISTLSTSIPKQNKMTTISRIPDDKATTADTKAATVSSVNNDSVTMDTSLGNSTRKQIASDNVTTPMDIASSKDDDARSKVTVTNGFTTKSQDETTIGELVTGKLSGLSNTTVPDADITEASTSADSVTVGDQKTTESHDITSADISVTTGASVDESTKQQDEPLTTETVTLPDDNKLHMSNMTVGPLSDKQTALQNQNMSDVTTAETVTLPSGIVQSTLIPDENTTSGLIMDSSTTLRDEITTVVMVESSTMANGSFPDAGGIMPGHGTSVTGANDTTVQSVTESTPFDMTTVDDITVPITQGMDGNITDTTASHDVNTTVAGPIDIGGDFTEVSEASNITITTGSPADNVTTEGQPIIIPGPIPIRNDTVTANDTATVTTSPLVTPSTRMRPPIIPILTTEAITRPRPTTPGYTAPVTRETTTYPAITNKKTDLPTPVVIPTTDITSPFIIPSTESEITTQSTTQLQVSTTGVKPPVIEISTIPPVIKSSPSPTEAPTASVTPTTEFQPSKTGSTELSTSSLYISLSTAPMTFLSSTTLLGNETSYSKTKVPMAIGITAGILALLAIIVLILLFKKKRTEKKRRGQYLDEENVSDYQFDLKHRPDSQISNTVWNNGYRENSFMDKPTTKNYFQEGIKENNNVKDKDEDDPDVIDVLHRNKSQVPPVPNSNRFSMGPLLLDSLDDNHPSTQHTYDTAYTHGTFKNASKA